MKLIENKTWAYAVMRFADIGEEHNFNALLEDTITVCPDSGGKIVDDEMFWKMLRENVDSQRFLKQNHIYSLEQLMEDYNEWYAENAFIDHYQYGDEKIIYRCE